MATAAEYNNSNGFIAAQGNVNYNGNVYLNSQQDQPSEDDKILDWLDPGGTNYTTLQNDYLSIRQPKTGEWLLQSPEYQRWLRNKSILFCTGMPGAGKTILTSIVIDDLICVQYGGSSDVGIAYIYFNYKRYLEQNINTILLVLLRQLAQGQRSSLPGSLKQTYNRHSGKDRPSRHEILIILRDIINAYSRTFILMDAIDECRSEGDTDCRSVVLEELFGIYREVDTNIHIFATSRPIPEIVTRFTRVTSETLEIRASDEDVRKYLESKIERSERAVLRKHKNTIEKEICSLVDGMFLLATLYFEAIKDEVKVRNINRILSQLATRTEKGKAKEIAAYDIAYEDAMTRINEMKGDAKVLAIRTLEWITCAKRPLTVAELQHAVAVEVDRDEDEENVLSEDDIPASEDLISFCAGLVTVDQESDIIRLVHYTTQEYFERTWQTWFSEAHYHLALTCITYMSYDTFLSGPLLSDEEFEERLYLHPLYHYAATYWGTHINTLDTRKQSQFTSLVLKFLQDYALRTSCVQIY